LPPILTTEVWSKACRAARLSRATHHYLAELQDVVPPARNAQFWNDVIAQERTQATTLQYAMEQDYARAQAEITHILVNELYSPTSD